MIIKGKSRASARSLGNYLSSQGHNERIQIVEVRGTVARDPFGAIVEMDAYGAGTKCEKPLYHAMINPQPPHTLTPEQRIEAVNALEKKLGLDGHARVVITHLKNDREHTHIVWSRIDLETMKAVSDSHNYRKHEECARDLERRFGHARVQGAHHEREGIERPPRTPSRSELRQEERTGITGRNVRRDVTLAYRLSDGPEPFRAALEERGYILARGDRRDFVIIDRKGGIHSLARRIEGLNAKGVREFMASLDPATLPRTDQVQSVIDDRRRLAREAEVARQEKDYGRSGDYVSQSSSALRDIQHQRSLSRAESSGKDKGTARKPRSQRTRGEPPDRQREAPGGGHTRSR